MVLYRYNRDEVTKMMNSFIDIDLLDEEESGFDQTMTMEEEPARSLGSSYFSRLGHMIDSWGRPKDYSRYQYSVGIYVPVQGEPDEAIALAQDFAMSLRPTLPPFGLKPLQELDLDNIEESLKLSEPETASVQ